MKYLLCLDTTMPVLSASVINTQGHLVSYAECLRPQKHLQGLTDILQSVLDLGGKIEKKDLVALGVTVGPGSFTGVRLGLLAMRSVAMAYDLPVLGITSLRAWLGEALWHRSQKPKEVWVLLDARRQKLYTARFLFPELEGQEGWEMREQAPQELQACWEQKVTLDREIVALGTAWYSPFLGERLDFIPRESRCWSRGGIARGLALAALESWSRKEGLSWREIAPCYLRDADVQLG